MKKIIFPTVAFLALIYLPAGADDFRTKGATRPDYLRGGFPRQSGGSLSAPSRNFLLYNKSGNAKYRVAPDPLRPSSSDYNLIINRDGHIKGRIVPDRIRKDSLLIEKRD